MAGVLARMLRPISLSNVALYLDAKAGTREQFVTAYELSGVRRRSALENYLVIKAANRIDSQRLYKTPAFLPPAEAWLQLMPMAVLVLLMLLGPYRVSSPLPPAKPHVSSAEEQQAFEKVCKALEKRIDAEKDKKRKEELQRIKDEVEELKNEELPQKEKVAKLNELMDRIRRMSFEAAREKAADMLEENELTRELGEAVRSGNDAAAEDALEDIENKMQAGELSQDEQEQVLENLHKAAEAAAEDDAMQEKLSRYLERFREMEMQDSLEELARLRDLAELAKALKERNSEMYEKEIEELLEKMQKGEMSREDIEAMQKAVHRAAEKMGDERMRWGLKQLEKSLEQTSIDKESLKELEEMLRDVEDENLQEMARELLEKLKKGEMSEEDMQRAIEALEKAAEGLGDEQMAELAQKLQRKLEGVDTEQIEKDLDTLMRLMKEADRAGCGEGNGDLWTQEDWDELLRQMEGLRRGTLGGSPDGAGGPGGEDSPHTSRPRPIAPGSNEPNVEGEVVDLKVRPDVGKGRSAGTIYIAGKPYPRGKAKRPYAEVLGKIRQRVLEKVETDDIPANYKRRVREFFSTDE